jgi:hypothetical protein
VDRSIQAYWRSQTALAAADAVLRTEDAMGESYDAPRGTTTTAKTAKKKAKKKKKKDGGKRRPASAGPAAAAKRRKARRSATPPRVARLARSRVADSHRGEGDVAWARTLDAADGWEDGLPTATDCSEGHARAERHARQTARLNATMRRERVALRESKRAARMRRRAKAEAHDMETLLPEENTRGGLDGRELKSWKILMQRHARVVSTAGVRVTSKLEKHVERRRKELRKKSRARFEFATANDGGMTGNQLEWWVRQRELHDRVVSGAGVRVDTQHEKHVEEERARKQKMRAHKDAAWSAEDGGLEGPEKKHWRIMTELHDKLIEDARPSISTRLDHHVLNYREALERKKKKDGAVEAGLSGRELKNWKLFQKIHDKIVDGATACEDSHLADHVLRYRTARQKKSKDRFKNFDASSGGLQGPELKTWQSVKETHDRVVSSAKVRVDVALPKHVEEERLRLRDRTYEKWKTYNPDVNGGMHGVELEHWKIIHKLHDKLVATAKPTTTTSLEPHVEHYRHHLQKKRAKRWSEPDNAGLEGRELKWWREQKGIFERLKGSAVSTIKREGEMELPKHIKHYREYLTQKRAETERTRGINDGMLSGPDLEHWRIMRKINDELIRTSKKTISVDHEKHVKRHMAYVVKRSEKRWDPKLGFTAGLQGPELHHWREMTKLHERVVGAAKPQVDCHHKKTVAEEAMERQLFEKWGGLAYSADMEMKKKRRKVRRERARARKARREAKRNRPLLSEAQYEKAVRIARLVHKDVYAAKAGSGHGSSTASGSSSDDSDGDDSSGGEYSDDYEEAKGGGGGGGGSAPATRKKKHGFDEKETLLLQKTALPSWQQIREDTDYVGQAAWRQEPVDFAAKEKEEYTDKEMEENAPPSYTRNRLSEALRLASEQENSNNPRVNSFGAPLYKRSPISFAEPEKR